MATGGLAPRCRAATGGLAPCCHRAKNYNYPSCTPKLAMMRPNGVGMLVAMAFVLSLIPLATADGAVAPPKCWKGKSGCTHTSTPHWNLRTFAGNVSVVGTRPQALTCADVASGAREEIVAGRYEVKFTLDRRASQSRVAADAQKQPITSKPLKLVFDVSSTTHERVRTL